MVPIEQRRVLLVVDQARRGECHDLVRCVGEHRLQVAQQHREQLCHDGLGAATLVRIRLLAVQTVLQRVEVDIGELGHHEVVERAVGAGELVDGIGIVHLGLHLRQAGEHETVERQQVVERHAVALAVVVLIEDGQQEAQGVAEAAVGVGRTGQDLVVAGDVHRGIHRGDPQADDVGAHLVADLVGIDHVTERLGHLTALAVEREALGDHGLVRGDVVRAHGGEQRALEPTAVLVGTLEVHVGRIGELGTVLADGLPGHAGVPPHVEDVSIGLEVMTAAPGAHAGLPQVLLGLAGEPGVGTLLVEELDHGVERVVVHDLLAAVLAGIARDGHAPVALTGDAPVRALLNHGADAVHRAGRVELHVVAHLVHGLLAKTGLVHGDEPLVGGAEEHRLLAAPAVRVAVRDLDLGHERAPLAQEVDDLGVGLIGIHAGERTAGAEALALVEATVVVNGHADVHALLHADVVVVDTVAGRVVDDTGTFIGAHVVGQQRHTVGLVEDGLVVVQVVEDLRGRLEGLAVHHDRGVLPAGDLADLLG